MLRKGRAQRAKSLDRRERKMQETATLSVSDGLKHTCPKLAQGVEGGPDILDTDTLWKSPLRSAMQPVGSAQDGKNSPSPPYRVQGRQCHSPSGNFCKALAEADNPPHPGPLPREREHFLRLGTKLRKGLRWERIRACPVLDTGVRRESPQSGPFSPILHIYAWIIQVERTG